MAHDALVILPRPGFRMLDAERREGVGERLGVDRCGSFCLFGYGHGWSIPSKTTNECLRLYGCFFFQAEDGIRDKLVTGVQTCALPIWGSACVRKRICRFSDATSTNSRRGARPGKGIRRKRPSSSSDASLPAGSTPAEETRP